MKKEIKNFIESNDQFIKSENTPVSITINEFAASSIDIKIICFCKTSSYLEYLKVKDLLAINLKEIVKNLLHKNYALFILLSLQDLTKDNIGLDIKKNRLAIVDLDAAFTSLRLYELPYVKTEDDRNKVEQIAHDPVFDALALTRVKGNHTEGTGLFSDLSKDDFFASIKKLKPIKFAR